MTPTSLPLPAASPSTPSFFEYAVLREVRRMDLGVLHFTNPHGYCETVSSPGADPRFTADIHVLDPEFFERIALFGDIGFGEAYTDGLWVTSDLRAVVAWAIHNASRTATQRARNPLSPVNLFRVWNRLLHSIRPNSRDTAKKNISEHYDLGNAFYGLWLDRSMTYSAARFEGTPATPLEDAQAAKYEALCRQLQIRPGDRVLEIGCGWGGFAEHAVSRHGCEVTGLTISKEQLSYANRRFEEQGIADRARAVFEDYRDHQGSYDKIVSIEMLEAVGDRYLETYFKKAATLLKPGGLFALQYITVPDAWHDRLRKDVDFIQKHIFPGSLLLSVGRVNRALQRSGDLFLHGLEDIGDDYARTLHIWRDNFNRALEAVRDQGFSEHFIRRWDYYLAYCEAAFDTRNISVVQAVYTRPNNYSLSSRYQEP